MAVLSDAYARYLDVVGSIYIYNEHRGYTSLDRVLAAARRHCPDETEFLSAIGKHRADERKHYLMFKRWFERQGRMPLALGKGYGHIDDFIHRVFGCDIDQLDTDAIVADPALFERLCRVIVLTEQRGLRQVDQLLRSKVILADPVMHRIFRIVHKDEPDHYLPYREWLQKRGRPVELWNERLTDWCVHKTLVLAKLPTLFLDGGADRLADWPDAGDPVTPTPAAGTCSLSISQHR